jgi:tetraacyldisaccharide 4'-kinase
VKPPEFWSRSPEKPGLSARLLAPLAGIYAAATARRVSRQARALKSEKPVICVGNINAGGTGKTPTVIALTGLLGELGKSVHVVSRGYGGSLEGPACVDPAAHDAESVGDEPLLMAAFAPVWVAKDRAAGVHAAIAAGADVVVLDDGFQNPGVNPDFALIVVDAVTGFGNGRVMPAGPLREPVEVGLSRADHLLTIGDDASQTAFRADWKPPVDLQQSQGRLVPLKTGIPFAGMRVFAFAGIGRPSKFFDTLRDLDAEIAGVRALDDHQMLTPALLTRIEREAHTLNAQLVTTEKDAVRLPPEWRRKVFTVPVRLELDDPEPLKDALSALF